MPILLNHLTKNQNSIPIEILAPISHQINTKNMLAPLIDFFHLDLKLLVKIGLGQSVKPISTGLFHVAQALD